MEESSLQDQVVLKPSIWKLLGLFLAAFVFVILGVVVIISDANLNTKLLGGYLCVIFFGGGALLILYKLILRKPTLIVSSYGIYPNYLSKSMRKWIPWKDIKKIGKSMQVIPADEYVTKQKYLVIYLKNPEKYDFERHFSNELAEDISSSLLSSIPDVLKRNLYIPSILLPYSIDKVLERIKKYPVEIIDDLSA